MEAEKIFYKLLEWLYLKMDDDNKVDKIIKSLILMGR